MDWTEKKAREAEATLRKWYDLAGNAAADGAVDAAIVEALSDDLNTAQALTELHQIARRGDGAALRASLQFLGLLGAEVPVWAAAAAEDLGDYASKLAELRAAAMQTKDFSAVDAMKSALLAAGAEVRMSKEGVEVVPGPDFDASKLEGV